MRPVGFVAHSGIEPENLLVQNFEFCAFTNFANEPLRHVGIFLLPHHDSNVDYRNQNPVC